MCISYTFGALLTANGNLRELNIMAVIAVLISIVLNLILIPRYKAQGSAIANAIAQVFTIIYHVVVAKYKFRFKFDYLSVIKAILLFAILITVIYFVRFIDISWVIKIGLTTFLGVVLMLAFKLLHLKSLIRLLASGKD